MYTRARVQRSCAPHICITMSRTAYIKVQNHGSYKSHHALIEQQHKHTLQPRSSSHAHPSRMKESRHTSQSTRHFTHHIHAARCTFPSDVYTSAAHIIRAHHKRTTYVFECTTVRTHTHIIYIPNVTRTHHTHTRAPHINTTCIFLANNTLFVHTDTSSHISTHKGQNVLWHHVHSCFSVSAPVPSCIRSTVYPVAFSIKSQRAACFPQMSCTLHNFCT